MRRRAGIATFIVILQSVLFLVHIFLYQTWTYSLSASAAELFWLKLALVLLSISFVSASLLAFRYTNRAVRVLYRVSAVWVGLLTFLFAAALASWLIFGVAKFAGLPLMFHRTVEILFAIAAAAGLYGVANASWTRITRTTVHLANLPASWRGRKAALVSDLHLGHVRNGNFLRRMVPRFWKKARTQSLSPAIYSTAPPLTPLAPPSR